MIKEPPSLHYRLTIESDCMLVGGVHVPYTLHIGSLRTTSNSNTAAGDAQIQVFFADFQKTWSEFVVRLDASRRICNHASDESVHNH